MPERGQTLLNRCGLHPFSVPMLCILDQLIQAHCDHAQNDDAGDDEMKLKNLAAIDNQVAKPLSSGEKLPDNHADKSQADIDLGQGDESRNVSGKHHFCKRLQLCAAQGFYQFQPFGISLCKGLV